MSNSPVTFVLVGTRSPGNVGAVCRLAKAFGFPDVRLVTPRLTADEAEAKRLAHGAEDVLARAKTFDSLRAALAGCGRAIATTARPRDWSRRVLSPDELAARTRDVSGPTAIVFGPEDRGLTNDDLAACDAVASIPLPPEPTATLSLPTAAAIIAWELAKSLGRTGPRPPAEGPRSARGAVALDTDELTDLLEEIDETLLEIGFRPRPNAVRFRGSLRDFLTRAHPTRGDRLMLRHILAQVGKWRRRLAGQLRRETAETRR